MTHKAFILLAGGSSNRMNGTVSDKILTPLLGKSVFTHNLSTFIRSNAFQEGVIVYRDETQKHELETACAKELSALEKQGANVHIPLTWTQGGKRRQDSSFLGIHATSEQTDWVCLHDCARPCLTLATLQSFIQEASEHSAAILVSPMTDTVKQNISEQAPKLLSYESTPQPQKPDVAWTKGLAIENIMKASRIPAIVDASEQYIRTVPREDLFCAQTPQAFRKNVILKALQHAFEEQITLTDDASALELMQQPVHMVIHTTPNPKLTYPHDFLIAEAFLKSEAHSD